MSHGTGWGEGFWNTKKALENIFTKMKHTLAERLLYTYVYICKFEH